jgi:hypothetical protein
VSGAAFPSPAAIHIWTGDPSDLAPQKNARAAPRRVPFGLASWSDDPSAPAIAVAVDVPDTWPASGHGSVAIVAAQLPAAARLAPGTLVIVLGEAASSASASGLLGRLLMRRAAPIARAVRGSALLARGYTRLGGGLDPASRSDLAWGFS